MDGTKFVLDTNAILYLMKGKQCMDPYKNEDLYVSVITKLELLSFPDITECESQCIESFLENCTIVPLEDNVQKSTIEIRRKYRIKLPDTIVAATAIALNYPLVTADKGFRKIEELDLHLIEP